MVRGNKYIEYQGDYYIVVGYGYQTKTPYSDRGDEHYYDCVVLNERNNRTLPSILAGKTIQVFVNDAKEIINERTLFMLELFYG